MSNELTVKFMALFRGREDAYGTGTGRVVRATLTSAQYGSHLAGEGYGLGVFPLADDGTVRFAAIDLDEPNFAAAKAMQKFLPSRSWIERSRSGNAHVWVFFDAPVEAWVARTFLVEAAAAAGKPRAEVFPKQERLREGGVGNYINLPYHGHDRPVLPQPLSDYRLDKNPGLPLVYFLRAAETSRASAEDWTRRANLLGAGRRTKRGHATQFGTQSRLHRCGEYMLQRRGEPPVGRGARHVALLAMAKMLWNWREPDEATKRLLLGLFVARMAPPLPESEVRRVWEDVRAREYTSTGCDDPLLAEFVDPDCPIVRRSALGAGQRGPERVVGF